MSKPYAALKAKYPYVISIPWPRRIITGDDGVKRVNADPNDLLRPVLETDLGAQFEAWDWCNCPSDSNNICIGMHEAVNAVKIKLEWG